MSTTVGIALSLAALSACTLALCSAERAVGPALRPKTRRLRRAMTIAVIAIAPVGAHELISHGAQPWVAGSSHGRPSIHLSIEGADDAGGGDGACPAPSPSPAAPSPSTTGARKGLRI